MSAPSSAPVQILGVEVSTASLEDSAALVADWAEQGPQIARYVCATSVHGLVEANHDPAFRDALNGAALVVPDGVPLVWVGRLMGRRRMERVFGPDLMIRICELTAKRPVRHFFYGGMPGVADLLAERLGSRFPGFTVAGTFCPPFRALTDAELNEITNRINGARTDILWVGLSTPKQERWIASIRDRLRVKVAVTVGAAFDYHTGRIQRAPVWMQRSGLEWAYRLAQEPGRLWRRYAYNNPVFIVLVLLQLLGLRRFGRPDRSGPR